MRMWHRWRRAGGAALVLALALTASAQSGVHPVSGRRFAPVMGIGGAAWLDRSEREMEEAPESALDALDIIKGSTVADVGAGSGYFTVRLAARVGDAGRVFATDLQPEMLQLLRARLADRHVTNVTLVQGTID